MLGSQAQGENNVSGVSPVIAVILMVAITVTISGVVFLWASTISSSSGSNLDLTMFEIKVKDEPAGDRVAISVMRGLENWDQARIIVTPDGGPTIYGDMSGMPNQSTAGDEILLSTFVDGSGIPVAFDVNQGDPVHVKIVNLNGNVVQAQANLVAA